MRKTPNNAPPPRADRPPAPPAPPAPPIMRFKSDRVTSPNQTAGEHEIQLTLAAMKAASALLQAWQNKIPRGAVDSYNFVINYGEVVEFMNARINEMTSIMNSRLETKDKGKTTSAIRLRRVLFKCERLISKHNENLHLAKGNHKQLLDTAQTALSTAYVSLRRLDSK